jgi:hypothetical protein
MSRIDHAKGSEAESWFGLERCVFGYVRGGAPVPEFGFALTGVMLYSSTEIIERPHNGTAVLRSRRKHLLLRKTRLHGQRLFEGAARRL